MLVQLYYDYLTVTTNQLAQIQN